AAGFQLPRGERSQFGYRIMAKKLGADAALHVANHGLEGLFTNLRPLPGLVAHAAALAAHAKGARFTSVLGPHGPPQPPPTHAIGHAQRVLDGGPSAAAFHALHRCLFPW